MQRGASVLSGSLLLLLLFLLTACPNKTQDATRFQPAAVHVLTPVSMQTACDGCAGPFDGIFEVFTGVPSISPALVLPNEERGVEERGAVEFQLVDIDSEDIVSVSLLLTVAGMLSGPAPIVEIHGFRGNGTVRLTDMQTSHLLQTSGPLTTLAPFAPIDVTAFVRSQVSDGTRFVGFMFRTIVHASGLFYNFTTDVPKLQVIITPSGHRTSRGHHPSFREHPHAFHAS